jgi:SAM-dependent methyltransferase
MNLFKDFPVRFDLFPFKKFVWKHWYNFFASQYKSMNISLMNYGYVSEDVYSNKIALDDNEEAERYCYQLYKHVASAVDLAGLDVLEIGCGRGGGASYIKRHLKPRALTGVDFSGSNINYCRKNHAVPGLQFELGDAENLSFGDGSFDVVINIESSHCYGNIEKFLTEVFRVLRPNGFFLFADFRPAGAVEMLRQQFEQSGFKVVGSENITDNVAASMQLENQRKRDLIKNHIPTYLRWLAHWFAAVEGTPIHKAFKSGKLEYVCLALEKKPTSITN